MGLWAGIKYALNSTLGTDTFMPLDKMVARGEFNAFDALYEPTTETVSIIAVGTEYGTRSTSPTKVAEITVPSDIKIVKSVIASLRGSSGYYGRIAFAETGAPAPLDAQISTSSSSYTNITADLGYGYLYGGKTYDVYLWSSNSSSLAYLNKITLIGLKNTEDGYVMRGMVKSVQRGNTSTGATSNYSVDITITSVNPGKAILILAKSSGQVDIGAYLKNNNTITLYSTHGNSITIPWQVIEFY